MAEESVGEKTEEPTAKRREDAKNEGRIWKSTELNAAVLMLGTLITMAAMGPALGAFLRDTMAGTLGTLGTAPHDEQRVIVLFRDVVERTTANVAAVSVSLAGVAILIAGIQAKGVLTLETITPKLERLNPINGFKRILPNKKLVAELLKQFTKMGIIGLVVWQVLMDALDASGTLANQPAELSARVAADFIVRLLAVSGLAYLALAVADLFWQRWTHEQDLRMTKQEVKQESKNQDGDPMIKARRRALARQRVRQQMLAKVPQASVVIVNPTHIAIALQYDPLVAPAPIVVAMGQRKVAERIKQLAREAGVPIVENRPLARAMLKACQVGAMIPAELYTAVAEVLAFVFRQRAARGWNGSAVA